MILQHQCSGTTVRVATLLCVYFQQWIYPCLFLSQVSRSDRTRLAWLINYAQLISSVRAAAGFSQAASVLIGWIGDIRQSYWLIENYEINHISALQSNWKKSIQCNCYLRSALWGTKHKANIAVMPTPELSNVPTITSLYSGITCG